MSLGLKNDNNVYILGAGFSREADMPLIGDFLLRMRDSHPWLQERNRTLEADAVQTVLQFRLDAASAAYWTHLDLENIEELFSLASSGWDSYTEKIQRAIAATLDYSAAQAKIAATRVQARQMPWVTKVPWLEAAREMDTYKIEPYAHYVGKLLGMMRDGQVKGENTFITFNYDTVLEETLEKLGVEYGYCFGKQSVDYTPSAAAVRNENPKVKVLKLHGSVNWGRRKKAGRTLAVFNRYKDVCAEDALPELIPPTWKKLFEDQLAYIWSNAVSALQSATRVIVIGFSIPPTDLHFKYLLAAGLKDNVSLRQMNFFNPAAEEIKTRTQNLLRQEYIENRRISFVPHGLRELCNDGRELTNIGRPAWLPGDNWSLQFDH